MISVDGLNSELTKSKGVTVDDCRPAKRENY